MAVPFVFFQVLCRVNPPKCKQKHTINLQQELCQVNRYLNFRYLSDVVDLQSLTDGFIENPTSEEHKLRFTHNLSYYSPRFDVIRLHKRRSLNNHRRHIEFLSCVSNNTVGCDNVCVTNHPYLHKSVPVLCQLSCYHLSQVENGLLGATSTSKTR